MSNEMKEQSRALEALQQSEARMRALLDAVPDMILELTRDGLITNLIPPKEMGNIIHPVHFAGKQIEEVLTATASAQTRFAIERSLETGTMNVFEFENEMGTELRSLEARVVSVSADSVLMMIRDITQRKWIETEHEKLIRELEEKNRESETLRESLASIVGTFEFSEIIQRVLNQIQLVIPYDSTSVWRLEGNVQKFISGRGLPADFNTANVEFAMDESNSALPILTGKAAYVLYGNVQDDHLPDFQGPVHNFVHSWLAVPLKVRGNIIGLIALDGRERNQFNEHHAQLAVAFANQVAIALDNADLVSNLQMELERRKQLIAELELKNVESEILRNSAAIVNETLEKDETIHRILEQLERVVPYDSASVQLVHGTMLEIVSARGLSQDEDDSTLKFEINELEPAFPVLNGSVPYILYDDVQLHNSTFAEAPHDVIHAWMAVPLNVKGKIIGIIALDGYTVGKFTERHAQLALTYANQVAITLENARLYSDLQSDLAIRQKLISDLEAKHAEAETLRESTAIVAATLEISETVQRILEQIKRVVQYDSASVWLYQGDKAYMMGSNGLPPQAERPGEYPLSDDEPDITLRRDGVPYILFQDIQKEYPTFRNPPMDYIHCWLTIPLRVRGTLIGFISLDSGTPGKFTEHDAELALTFASQVSIAIENARLFSDLQAELEARQKLISELESKNAELERFTYTVSHDLKSPLFTIRGFLGYLEQDARSGNAERMNSDMQRIIDATDRMQRLLNELLELSRVGRLVNEPAYIPFDELAREAVELVQGRIMENGVEVHIDAKLPTVYGDRQRLLEVVQNLVDNAAKFVQGQPDPRIEIGCDGEEDEKFVFHVRDNGIGIPPEHHERIFGLFNKLDVKTDGTGIGLTLVRRIIEFHGGRIWVQSEAGQGAVFFFTLPANPPKGISK